MSVHRRHRFHVGHHRWGAHLPARSAGVDLGPRFTRLWMAGIASNIADGITAAALPLLAAVLTRDPLVVALVAALHSLPWFVFELIAGEIVDRADRRKLMIGGNVARATGIGLIGVLIASETIELWSLGAIAFGIGVAETLVDTSWEAIVPRLVPEDALSSANGRTQAAEWTANELVGPPLGGFLFAAAAAAPFFLNGGAFLVAAALIALIPGVYASSRNGTAPPTSMRKDIAEGIRWLWGHRVLRGLSLTAGAANLMGTATFAVFVLYAQDVLDVGEIGFGMILAAAGVGGIIGAAIAHRVETAVGTATVLLASMGGIGIAALAIALTESPIVVGLAFAVDGFLIAMWNVVVVSLRQALTPDELRGRIASDARTIAFGAIPIGALVGGILADRIGLRAPFVVAAVVYAVTVVSMARIVSNQGIAELRAEAPA